MQWIGPVSPYCIELHRGCTTTRMHRGTITLTGGAPRVGAHWTAAAGAGVGAAGSTTAAAAAAVGAGEAEAAQAVEAFPARRPGMARRR